MTDLATVAAYAINIATVRQGEVYTFRAFPHGAHWFEPGTTPEEAVAAAVDRIKRERAQPSEARTRTYFPYQTGPEAA